MEETVLTNEEFCRELCLGASRARIACSHEESEGKHRYVFLDVASYRKIAGSWADNNQSALFSACTALSDYFNDKSNA